jgi:hypothetical protein
MKQKKLVKELLKACIEGDESKIDKIRAEEYKKIFKHKEKNKPFSARWTAVRL